LDAITIAREIEYIAQNLFDNNFDISTGVELEDDSSLPFGYSLLQNYPNPFNPSTSIQYAISSRQFVVLKVYDVLGNEVATLVNEVKHAGSYEVEFDGTRLTSGIYFYRIISGSYSDTKKLVLLK
ncbi:MAG: T9SS type A sorting domain-containing protein, partial [Bacteroidetes bacterium]|nr:T9SS type A sorting domain-containing protein [Bacteroidota bacterium]